MAANEKKLSIDVIDKYQKVDENAVDALLAQEIAKNPAKIVVLDDDPTGVQTVHDISVYTEWTDEAVRQGFEEDNKCFYILTNSRGMTQAETTKCHRDIGRAVNKASKETGKPYFFISRSDSTLRGHYPLETELLREAMEGAGLKVDGEILCPFFKEGGRYTIDDVHYVEQGGELVPAAQTEFAKDVTFGYSHSSIPEYIEEKTAGKFKAADVTCISLNDLRNCRYDKIEEQLKAVKDFNKVCVNAVDYCDVKVFAVALYRAMAAGRRFLFRSAAGLVKVLAGISDRPLLKRGDMVQGSAEVGGLVVVGSHTAKTTEQLKNLLTLSNTEAVEFNSDLVLEGEEAFEAEVLRCVKKEEEIMKRGKTAVAFTKRKLLEVENDTKESALIRSIKISDGVQSLVGKLDMRPAFVIAKGGITSSDVGTKALAVKRALVLGQILPGIPVWQTGDESKFPGIPYVIFPGNTGGPMSLKEAVEILSEK